MLTANGRGEGLVRFEPYRAERLQATEELGSGFRIPSHTHLQGGERERSETRPDGQAL